MNPEQPKKKVGKVKYVEPYDFKRPKLFSKEIMRTLRSIHDSIARSLNRIFNNSLRYKVDVRLKKIEQYSPSDFTEHIDSPSVIYLMQGKDLTGEIIVVLPTEFCIHVIERQSGGTGVDLSSKRVLTVIEEKIISRIMAGITAEIIQAWEPYVPLIPFMFNETIYESKPENLHLSSVDPMLSAVIGIDMGETVVNISISYSYGLLKKVMNENVLKERSRNDQEKLNMDDMEGYKLTLHKARVNIQPLLGQTSLSLDEIMNLKEGDTIPLKQKSDEPLDIRINGVKKMNGYPGLKQGRRAIRIFEIVDEINEQELV
ncbi:MAG: FliM/FliN family flagellar motor switch protein [Balneolales bacterium]|nr:FliM/FliN family flagellar motor switch protein [Balneolales bacterium]